MRTSGPFAGAVILAIVVQAGLARAQTQGTGDCGEEPAPADTDTSVVSSSSTSSGMGSSGSGKGGVAVTALLVVGFTLAAPLTIVNLAIENDPPPCGWSFQSAPYAEGAPGYLVRVGTTGPGFFVPPDRRRFGAGQLSLEGLPPVIATGEAQGGGALRLRLQSDYRVEFEAAESVVGVDGGPSPWFMGTEHVSVRFAQADAIQLRLGAGLRHGTDAGGTVFGFDGLFGADIDWGRPLTTSLEITAGTYGSLAAVQPRGTVGVVFGDWEVYAGYQALMLVGNRSTFTTSSPIVGVRAYF